MLMHASYKKVVCRGDVPRFVFRCTSHTPYGAWVAQTSGRTLWTGAAHRL